MLYDIIKKLIKLERKESMNLNTICDEFIQAKSLSKSPHTINDYSLTMRRLKNYFIEDTTFVNVTVREIQGFLTTIPGSDKNVLNACIALSSLYTWAIKQGYAERHIMRQIEWPDPIERVIRPFSKEEVIKLLHSFHRFEVRNQAIVLLLLDTGIRASEICGIKLNDINGSYFRVLGKGSKEREVPASDRSLRAIIDYISNRKGQNQRYLFTTDDGNKYNRDALLKLIHRAGERSGVENAHPHRFRHTFAVNYLLNGGDPFTLQRILGHTTMEMVNRYLDFTKADLAAVHRKASPVQNWAL